MRSTSFGSCLAVVLSLLQLHAGDWPRWRGPTANGVAEADQNPPVTWNESLNVLWRARVPGGGHGSPTIVGDAIYLASADLEQQTQSIICFDRRDGRIVWQTPVHRGNLDTHGHRNTSQASSTVAFAGDRLYINFLNDGAIHTTALDIGGKILWQHRVGDFVTHQGFASSPVVHESLVLVSADHKGGGVIVALDASTGELVWKQDRPRIANYTSPRHRACERSHQDGGSGLQPDLELRSGVREETLGDSGFDRGMRDHHGDRRRAGICQRRISEEH